MNDARRALRALPTLFRVGLAGAVAYRSEMFIWVLTTNMPLVMLALWTAVAREAPVGRFHERDFVAYFLVALIVRLLTSSWVVWEMNMEIRQGNLSMRLLRPIHPLISYAVDNIAAMPFKVILSLPVAIVAFVVAGSSRFSHEWLQWLVVPFSFAGAFALTYCAMALIGSIGLFFESSLALLDLWLACSFVFSGYLLPLEFFPHRLYVIVRWLPFRYTLSFPVETVLGLTSVRETFLSLAVQWAYAAVFLMAALRLWRAGLRRYAAYGG